MSKNESKDQLYSIKDLENLTGIKAHTLRIWEQRYMLLSPSRTTTNIRYYSDEDVKKLLNINILYKNGEQKDIVNASDSASIKALSLYKFVKNKNPLMQTLKNQNLSIKVNPKGAELTSVFNNENQTSQL